MNDTERKALEEAARAAKEAEAENGHCGEGRQEYLDRRHREKRARDRLNALAHPAAVLSLLEENAKLREALEPFARYAEMRAKKPLRGLGRSIHHIHPGDECEAEIHLDHCEAARSLLTGEAT